MNLAILNHNIYRENKILIMIIVEVNNGIEKALKKYKAKHKRIKVNEELRDRKEFTKKSVKKRQRKLKAIYIQKLKDSENND